MSLRVMTWNLWWQFGDHALRERAIAEVIATEDPDVICLQEVWVRRDAHQAEILADRLGMHWVANDPVFYNDAAFANAIMSRWPVTRVLDERLPDAEGRLSHRRLVMAEVDSPWGRWPVISTHLEHRFDRSATRSAQIAALLGAAAGSEQELPVVIGADLNAVPDSDEVRMLTGRSPGPVPGLVMSDVWEQVGQGPGHTWRRENPHVEISAWPNRRIDYLLVAWPRPKPVGNPITVHLAADRPVEVEVEGRTELVWASDHAAVVAELQT